MHLIGRTSMKTETKRRALVNGQALVKHVTVKGQRMVMLPEDEYDRLLQRADEWEPALPAVNERGNYPATETVAVLLAREILRARRKLGLSQVELARRAGIRPETLKRIEQGRNKPSVPTIVKIDRALKARRSENEYATSDRALAC
jgi:ribosome-binding protein aMBF1 (putative translation factor)